MSSLYPRPTPGDRSLVAQDRVDAARVLARPEEGLGLGPSASGPELVERAVVARRQDPPPGLAFTAEFLHQHAGPVRDADPQHGAARLRAASGGASTSTRPPCDRWTSRRSPPSSSITTYLPRRTTRSICRPSASSGRGANVFSDENWSGSRPASVRAGHDLVEPFGERLHLRHLRHGRHHRPRSSSAAASDDLDAFVDAVLVRAMRHDARAQHVAPVDHRARQEHPLRGVDAFEERPLGRRRRRPPAGTGTTVSCGSQQSSIAGVVAERVGEVTGEVELLVQGLAEGTDTPCSAQRHPHAQSPPLARELGRVLRCSWATRPWAADPGGRRRPRSARRASPRRRAPPNRRCRTAGRGPCADRGSPSRSARCPRNHSRPRSVSWKNPP